MLTRDALARSLLAGNVRRHPRSAAGLAVWCLVQALPAVASGWVVSEAVTRFLAGQDAGGFAWLGLLFLAGLAGAVASRQVYTCLGGLAEPLRDDLVAHVVASAVARSMDPARPPDTHAVARLTHQAEIVRDSYAGVLTVACIFACTAGSTIAGLVTLVPATLPYALPPLAGSVLALRLLLRPLRVRQRRAVTGEETLAESAAEAISGIRDVVACGADDLVMARLTDAVERQADAARSTARLSSARVLCIAFGGWLPLLLVLAAMPSLLRSGVSAARVIGAITYLSGSLRSSLNLLSEGVGSSIIRLTVTLDRILEATVPPPQTTLPPAAAPPGPGPGPGPGRLELRNVTFGYGRHAEPIIRDLSIDIDPGAHVAIVGPSGIGKSSLACLLAGMLAPTAGEVLLDDVPAARAPRRRVLIPQEAYVFAGPLDENICYLRGPGDRPAREELDAAAAAVGLSPLVSRLGGYLATVNPAALSAGERQLIALTRAFLSRSPIAILDEATCHLDPAAEQRAEAAFADRPGTLIVVAHRISSALRAERVLVLDGSRARAGDHATLLTSSPMYAELVGYWTGGLPPRASDVLGQRLRTVTSPEPAQGKYPQ
jgi:ABC-type multidrug transport system fused ATPase/permease subunit